MPRPWGWTSPRGAGSVVLAKPRSAAGLLALALFAALAFPWVELYLWAEAEGRVAELLTVAAAVALLGGAALLTWWTRRQRRREVVRDLVAHGLLEAEIKCPTCGSMNAREGPARCTTCGRALPPIPGAPEG